jgi:hypothetical protein
MIKCKLSLIKLNKRFLDEVFFTDPLKFAILGRGWLLRLNQANLGRYQHFEI